MKKRIKLATLTLVIPLSIIATVAIQRLQAPDITSYEQGTTLLDRNDVPLRIMLDRKEQDKRPVDLQDISPWVQAAIVSVEDQRFLRHPGIDPLAIIRAIGQNLRSRRRISGASTISTQVIRLSEPRPRTWRTKAIETIKALQLERDHDKIAILEAHLNLAPFGGNLIGIEAAARWYFDKSAADLTLTEAALLAGLPQSPTRLRPDRNLENARTRMHHVLERMKIDGIIDAQQHQAATHAPLQVQTGARPFAAPHFTDMVMQQTSRTGKIRTTLDAPLQYAIQNIAAQHESTLRSQKADRIAIVILQVKDSAVLSLLGSYDYFDSETQGMVNASRSRRSPGSALKPLIYALAIDQGSVTPATMLDDRPAGYRDINPANFDGHFRGNVSLRDALILSLNIPALKMVEHIGVQRVIDNLQAFGLHTIEQSADHYGTGIAIGGAEVRLLDLVAAYAAIARGGTYLPPRLLADTTQPSPRPILSEEAAYIVTDIMGGTERSYDLFGHIADATLPRAAWKTGTSSAYRDAWTVAWTPDHVIGVWIGNTDGSPTQQRTGANAAAPVVADILRQLYPQGKQGWFTKPDGIRVVDLPDGGRDLHIAGISSSTQQRKATDPVRITQPADGTRYRMSPNNVTGSSIPLKAESTKDTLYWFANGTPLGTTRPEQTIHWQLRPGTHTITCSTACGQESSITLIVET